MLALLRSLIKALSADKGITLHGAARSSATVPVIVGSIVELGVAVGDSCGLVWEVLSSPPQPDNAARQNAAARNRRIPTPLTPTGLLSKGSVYDGADGAARSVGQGNACPGAPHD